MATLESLQTKIQRLQAQADALRAKKSSAVIQKIKNLMAEHGLTTADIDAHTGGKKRGPKPGAKAAAKAPSAVANYRDPKTGATWSGRGRTPRWIANAKDRSKFLVGDDAAVSTPAIKKTAKAGNYVRGPQPALYRDPKTGATWSGRARPPAWIANAKDRTKFLIEGAAAADKKPVQKAAAKQAPAVKKTVAKKSASAKVSAKKASAKTALRKSATAPAPDATVDSRPAVTV
ncbi:DNA-binding protein H-NS [Paraburkholderia sp. GV068]|uniref:H-NS family nucleoid-associated regulatory protein n=1 Tax=unclassified Paraburkholderia TaxID=2615204 RepID=UPI000D30BF45|nr:MULTISPECIES: H-NS family nucleoid-associated regulatory protein [unclassified Paraburkholderia]PTQ96513.1 DNA-binding protein H-NS [Paraburkholderia sp. GV072]PUB00751.1 DNA-binding protein H-NS [Paraburkholderia sp. GV068]